MLVLGLAVLPLTGQTTQKIANINKKIIGKWVTADRKTYIEFRADESCSNGSLGADGKWHVDNDKLGAWQEGDDFMCGSGALTLIGPNTLTRDYGMGGEPDKFYRGSDNIPKPAGSLTVAVAQRILNQQVNQATVNNTLLTCHACYNSDDKKHNDSAVIVSTFSASMNQFLIEHGYIRAEAAQSVFTGKAKRSKYYQYNDGAPGLRLADFKNPRILTSRITDPRHVPVQYDLVPTEITAAFFGKVQVIKASVKFSTNDNEAWEVCMACRE
jgi:hypothetical protein